MSPIAELLVTVVHGVGTASLSSTEKHSITALISVVSDPELMHAKLCGSRSASQLGDSRVRTVLRKRVAERDPTMKGKRIIEPRLTIARAPLLIDAVHLFVRLSPKCVGLHKTRFSQKLGNLKL